MITIKRKLHRGRFKRSIQLRDRCRNGGRRRHLRQGRVHVRRLVQSNEVHEGIHRVGRAAYLLRWGPHILLKNCRIKNRSRPLGRNLAKWSRSTRWNPGARLWTISVIIRILTCMKRRPKRRLEFWIATDQAEALAKINEKTRSSDSRSNSNCD